MRGAIRMKLLSIGGPALPGPFVPATLKSPTGAGEGRKKCMPERVTH